MLRRSACGWSSISISRISNSPLCIEQIALVGGSILQLPITMLPELFHFNLFGHEIHLYTYGLMMIVGFFAAVYLAKYLANRSGLDGEAFVNAGLIALISGVIGARLSHVLENWKEFSDPH